MASEGTDFAGITCHVTKSAKVPPTGIEPGPVRMPNEHATSEPGILAILEDSKLLISTLILKIDMTKDPPLWGIEPQSPRWEAKLLTISP